MKVTNDRHAFWVKSFAVFVDDADAELVIAFIFWGEANAQCKCARRMYNGELTSKKGVKCALNAKFALIISCVIAKRRYLEIHDVIE